MEKENDRIPKNGIELLNSLIGKKVLRAYYHYWGIMDDKKYSLDWIELYFSGYKKICFTAGNRAENLDITDFEKEKMRIINGNEDCDEKERSFITTRDVSKEKIWKLIINKKLNKYEIKGDDKLDMDTSIILHFPDKKIEIYTEVDNVDIKEV